LIQAAKASGVPVILVGHVTKDGDLAGPKLLEHMVDVVLYLEGESAVGFRTLSSTKNRFGAAQVFGVFEMTGDGMNEVEDPSRALLGTDLGRTPGTVVFPALQGRRPVTVEVQALVAPTGNPQPRRSIRGFEPARVHQLLAVLERHAGLSFADHEVYVTAVGGMRLREPAADLPIALALASSFLDRPVGSTAAFGEMGLTGEIRPVPLADRRTAEVSRLGLESTIAPSPVVRHITDALLAAGLARPA
jgi:DNA repair protein RadA/Sms